MPFLLLLPLLLRVAARPADERLAVGDGHAGWSGGGCPCSEPKLCEPITKPRSQEDVYAFHTTGNTSWQHYDWSQITTVCVFGAVDPQLLCKAHSVGARVTLGSGGPPKGSWNSTAAVGGWVAAGVARVKAAKADGLNLDVEIAQDDPQQLAGLTPACKQMADAMHSAQPGSHVTFDTPSEGETGKGQSKCGDMYGRDYDYKALAEALDFFVVMDYDSNDAHDAVVQPIAYEPAGSHPYIYTTRAQAAAACAADGDRRLCSKAELKGFERCAYGWTSDWNGYWMASAKKGCENAGFNPNGTTPHQGPAGAYCCGGDVSPVCPTCFFANAALPVVKNGVECYAKLGVPPAKLVLAFPWCECNDIMRLLLYYLLYLLSPSLIHSRPHCSHCTAVICAIQMGTTTPVERVMSRAPTACAMSPPPSRRR